MLRTILVLCIGFISLPVLPQGQDGSPAQRNLMVLTELLPGRYDNANQAYFDQRLKLAEDRVHNRMHVRIQAITLEGSDAAFQVDSEMVGTQAPGMRRIWVLDEDSDPMLVRMRMYALEPGGVVPFSVKAMNDAYLIGCDVFWRRDTGQFSGSGRGKDCASPLGEGYRVYQLQLDPAALWINIEELDAEGQHLPQDNPVPYQLNRARPFSCYVDIPGVAGGRDEPFDRYPIEEMHDQGAMHWFTTKDGKRELGINLRNVVWPMNNELDAFTRNSLVLYVLEREDGEVITHSYGWTQPQARRIGLNLQWLLVNCFQVSNRDVRPFFETTDPPGASGY